MQSKEEYYRYGIGKDTWDIKEPDVLPGDVVEMMKREKVDDRFRFVWMGAGVLRTDEFDVQPVVIGDRAACHYVKMQVGFQAPSNLITDQPAVVTPRIINWLQPKDLFVRVKKEKFWYWTDDEGNIHQAPRPDDLVAPPGVLAQRFDVMIELGHLVWQLQYRLTGEQLVAGHFYSPANAANEYWHTIKTFRSATHGYLQPTCEDVENMILKREHETRHLSTAEMRELIKANALAEHKRGLEARAAQEAEAKAAFDAMAQDIINFSMQKAPNAGGMAVVT